jgi:hypothetical protein
MTRNRFPGQFFGFSLSDQVDRMRIYLELLQEQFYRWGYILLWIGAWERLRTEAKSALFLLLAALGLYVFGMNYGGVTFRMYLIPSYMIFAVFLGCALGTLRGWLADRLLDWPRWLSVPVLAGVAAVILVMPLYPLSQNWARADESGTTRFRDLSRSFVDHTGPDFVLVDSEWHYDEVEAILYAAWAEKGWYNARTVTPGEIDAWLGSRPVYAWHGDPDLPPRYVEEPVPGLPDIVRLVGVKEP